jgi:hypothetical protein
MECFGFREVTQPTESLPTCTDGVTVEKVHNDPPAAPQISTDHPYEIDLKDKTYVSRNLNKPIHLD